MVEFWE